MSTWFAILAERTNLPGGGESDTYKQFSSREEGDEEVFLVNKVPEISSGDPMAAVDRGFVR